MNIIVCAKVYDGEINIFDRCAIECALQLSSSVTVISMGPESAKAPLRELTRLGVKVIMLTDKAFAGSDTLVTSYILSRAINQCSFDLIICGRQTTDGDTAQTGAMLGTKLNLPIITNVLEILECSDKIHCRTRLGEESERLPALITVERINTLRFPKMRSKASQIEVWDSTCIDVDLSKCGATGSPTQVLKVFQNKSGTRKCRFIKRWELLPLIEALKAKELVQNNIADSPKKFKNVWIVGKAVEKIARSIAEGITIIEEENPLRIAEKALKECPEVILWNADFWGRKNAPIVAALLHCGLSADCVNLECDGKTLFMYRPARSGNVIAKIISTTSPQMATVRTGTKTSEIMVCCGRGVAGEIDKIKDFAKSINGEFSASRAVVDMGVAPIECQVGLTGKTVAPKIYIAVGVSGAVHHTCAIENAGTIIAINPDKNARIFEYADFGILEKF